MFEVVIAPIAFALIMLVIFGAAIIVYVRRRMTRGTGNDPTYELVHPDGWSAADDAEHDDAVRPAGENDRVRDQRRAG